VGWTRIFAALVVGLTLFGASPAQAQDEPEPTGITVLDDTDVAQPDSEIVRDDETSDTIQGIRRNLLLIAGLSGVGLLVFVWHTSPSRRFRIATERARAQAVPRD
jgi:hypothetical protein